MLKKIVYQGVPGSFSEEAAIKYFGAKTERISVQYFEEVFVEVTEGNGEFGVLPLANSLTGGVYEVLDLINVYNLYIVGEVYLPIKHHLRGIPGASIEQITEVYSHPQGFQQCSRFLTSFSQWMKIPYFNTAISAQYIKDQASPNKACIASERAAEIYGLQVLKPSIQNNNHNYTRFIIIGKEILESDNNDKVSIVYSLPHKAGSLFQSLSIFSVHDLNLLRLESRPIPDRPWEFYFYVDFTGNLLADRTRFALELLKEKTTYFKLLGCYKSAAID